MEENEIKKRFTAFRLPLGMINQGNVEFEQERFSRLILGDKEIVRVNIIANVVDKYTNDEKQYCSVTIDDGTGNIRIKSFSDNIRLLKNIEIGDTVVVIGLLRFFNEELYILPEIVKLTDPRWLIVRKLEFPKEYSNIEPLPELEKREELKNEQEEVEVEKIVDAIYTNTPVKIEENTEREANQEEKTLRTQIIDSIHDAENEGGIDIDKLIMSMKAPVDEINSIITELLEEGTIYEPKPGSLRIL